MQHNFYLWFGSSNFRVRFLRFVFNVRFYGLAVRSGSFPAVRVVSPAHCKKCCVDLAVVVLFSPARLKKDGVRFFHAPASEARNGNGEIDFED